MPPPTSTTVRTASQSPSDQDVGVGGAVSQAAHQRVEARRDLRMGVQIFPERPTEDLVVGGHAGPDDAEQAAPGERHPTADAIEIEAKP